MPGATRSIASSRKVFEYLQKLRLIPKELKETDLYILGLSFIVLLIFTQGLSHDLLRAAQWDLDSTASRKGGIVYSIALLIISSPIAIYIALTNKKINKFQSYCIKFFFVVVNALIAIAIGIHSLQNASLYLEIIAIWQISQAVIFIIFSGFEEIGDFYDLPKRQARLHEVILATLIVLAVTAYGDYKNWYWALIFSSILLVWRIADGFLKNDAPARLRLLYSRSPVLGSKRLKA